MQIRAVRLVLAAVLLSACTTTPAAQRPSTAEEAARRTEFSIIPEGRRQAFPTWQTTDLDGYRWSSNGSLADRFAVVNFWASWCQPCIDEWPELQAAANGHPSVQFIGINTMDQRADARVFLSQHKSEYRHLMDADAMILKSLRGLPTATLPTTIVLDKQHRVAAWKVGPVLRGQIRRVLAALLPGSSN